MPIRVLDATVAAQIAAGEVVERPASVVKELVENALDAGARRVSVGVRGGGIEELVIQDDGGGIPADEIAVAFSRHATSKLSQADDLWAIKTLGFRGEALPSIAAIAQVSCISRTADAPAGVELRIAGSEIQAITPRGAAVGTTFTIRNLFYNIPVRREFLKSPASEATAISAVVTQYALAYPEVAFTLLRDGKRVFQTTGRGQLADVILELYGLEVARQMIPVEGRAGEDLGAVQVQGLISAPTLSRNARDGMHITVNGRAIQPRGLISGSIEEAYHTLLMKGRFPLVALHIQVNPAAVDVNVHPTKSEVKFRQPQLVGRTIGRAVHDALQRTTVVQRWADPAPSQDSQPTSTESQEPSVEPRRPDLSAAGGRADAEGSIRPDLRSSPASLGDTSRQGAAERARPTWDTPSRADAIDRSMARPGALKRSDQRDEPPHPATSRPERDLEAPPSEPAPIQAPLLGGQIYGDPDVRMPSPPVEPARADRETAWTTPSAPDDRPREERPLHEPPAAYHAPKTEQPATLITHAEGMPPLRALAQLAQTYLLTEGPSGALYLIDQHAAHERITYERLLAQHAAGTLQSQALLLPQEIPLPPHDQQVLLGAADALADWGFALNEAERGVEVQSVPVGLEIADLATTLADLASHLSGQGANTLIDQRDLLLATLACHTSVRAGQTLSMVEQQALIDQLSACAGPRTCPHGRPTLIVLTKHQLERQFGRLGA